jgi:hypothetical protein
MDRPEDTGTLPHLLQSEYPTEVPCPTQQQQSRAEPRHHEDKGNATVAPPIGSDTQDATCRMDTDQIEPKRDEKDSKSDVEMVARPLSPPKHPRFRDAQPPSMTQRRRESRSPPRGPRNHPKNMAAPSASSSFPPTGLPRGPRSQYLQPMTLASQDSTPSTLLDEPPGPTVGSDAKAMLPLIPTQKPRPSLTPELDIEVRFPLPSIRFLSLIEFDRSRVCRRTELISLPNTCKSQKALDGRYMSWILPHLIYVLQKVDVKWRIVKWKKLALECLVSTLAQLHLRCNSANEPRICYEQDISLNLDTIVARQK